MVFLVVVDPFLWGYFLVILFLFSYRCFGAGVDDFPLVCSEVRRGLYWGFLGF